MSAGHIGGVLLAAGTASRFGSDKRFALLADGDTLLQRTAKLLETAADEGLLVIGENDDPLRFRNLLPQWRVVRSADSALGMGASLAAGVRSAPGGWRGLMVMLADKPFVTRSTIRAVAASLDNEIVVPRHQGEWGHPVGFPRRLFEAMTGLSGDAGARRMIEAEEARCRFLDVDDPGVLLDIDTPERLRALVAQFG